MTSKITPPFMLYGTAFKGELTQSLTEQALLNGFLSVDSANFPASYNEPLVGDAIASVIESGVDRSALFIQTKFTPAYAFGNHAVPYDTAHGIADQIRESLNQSLCHLKTDYIDCFLLHAPLRSAPDTVKAWSILETFVPHTIRTLGVSNFTLPQLRTLYEQAARVKPAVVQNSFCRARGFDISLRVFCSDHGITYQAYHLLRHNPDILSSDVVAKVSSEFGVEKQLAFYILVLGLGGIQVLNGTTKLERMVRDTETINKVFAQGGSVLPQPLQEDISSFRELLRELAGYVEKEGGNI